MIILGGVPILVFIPPKIDEKAKGIKTLDGFHSIFLQIPNVIGNNIAIAPILFIKEDKRATAWIREAIYSELKRSSPTSVYNEAMAKDQAEWRQSIRKRVEGRIKQKD